MGRREGKEELVKKDERIISNSAKETTVKEQIEAFLVELRNQSNDYAANGLLDKEKYIIPPHLHDLTEDSLPEGQRGLVISEIAQFRERAAKRVRYKREMRDNCVLDFYFRIDKTSHI